MLILPAIDLLDGRCVRLTEGVFGSESVYSDDPVETALGFADQGAEWIHVVDLDGARDGSPANLAVIGAVCRATSARVQCGGGVRSVETAGRLFDAGVSRVVVGSALTKGDEVARGFFESFGDRVAAGIDTRNGKVAVSGWAETSMLDGLEFAKSMVALGCKCVVTTEITRDGRLGGPDVEGVSRFVSSLGTKVIASGGVSSLEDVERLKQAGASGTIVGKALYERRFSLPDAIAAGS